MEARRKDNREDSYLGFLSSTTNTAKFTWTEAEAEAGFFARMSALFNLLKEKYPGKEITVVLLATCQIQKYIEKSISRIPALELFVVSGDDLQKRPWVPDDNRLKLLIGWEPSTAVEYWIDNGWIHPDWYVYALAKDAAIRAKIKAACNYIELWSTAEDASGVKFPGCTEYHLLSYECVKDENNEYTFSDEGCKCGVKGPTFTVQALSLNP